MGQSSFWPVQNNVFIMKGNCTGRWVPFGNKRSIVGGTDIWWQEPREISANELMKCEVDIPSLTTWFIVQLTKVPSTNYVTWNASNGCDVPS